MTNVRSEHWGVEIFSSTYIYPGKVNRYFIIAQYRTIKTQKQTNRNIAIAEIHNIDLSEISDCSQGNLYTFENLLKFTISIQEYLIVHGKICKPVKTY